MIGSELNKLYQLCDELTAACDANGILTRQVDMFPAGQSLLRIGQYFAELNRRFTMDAIKPEPLRLTPLYDKTYKYPVLDEEGYQICVGDEVSAKINVGRYGQMKLIAFKAQQACVEFGAIETGVPDSNGVGYSLYTELRNHDSGVRYAHAGREHHDVEHHFKETACIVNFAHPQPVIVNAQPSTPSRPRG